MFRHLCIAVRLFHHCRSLTDWTRGARRCWAAETLLGGIDSYRRGIAGTMPGVDLLDGVVALWKCLGRGDDVNAYRLYFPISA